MVVWLAAFFGLAMGLTFSGFMLSDLYYQTLTPAAENTTASLRAQLEGKATLTELGQFPVAQFAYDGTTKGHLATFGAESADGGNTWRPLLGARAESAVSLRGAKTETPAIGPTGEILHAEVLFHSPNEDFGRGPIAHLAEWKLGSWRTIVKAAPEEEARPVLRVFTAGYFRDKPFHATQNALSQLDGPQLDFPGAIRFLRVMRDGSLWAATVSGGGRFSLYWLPKDSFGFSPVPVPPDFQVVALGDSMSSVLVAGLSTLLVLEGEAWRAVPWPSGFVPTHVAGHPKAPLVAAWSELELAVGTVSGPLRRCRLGTLVPAFAAWDPFDTETLTVTDRTGRAVRLRLDSVK